MTEAPAISGMMSYTMLAMKRDWALSAYPHFKYKDGSSYRDAHVRGFFRESIGEVEQIKPKCLLVASPWHAALLLQSIMNACALDGERLIFRGQANSDWPINASLHRSDVDRDLEIRKANIFCRLLASISWNTSFSMQPGPGVNLYLRVSPATYIAAASTTA